MHISWVRLCITSLIWGILTYDGVAETYQENLELKQFPDGRVLAQLTFERKLPKPRLQERHYNLLPKTVGEVIHKFNVSELHLTFTHGRWNYQRWGFHPHSAPVGVQLWAFLGGEEYVNLLYNRCIFLSPFLNSFFFLVWYFEMDTHFCVDFQNFILIYIALIKDGLALPMR